MSRLSELLGIYEINERWNSTKIQDGTIVKTNESPELDSVVINIINENELNIKINDIVGFDDGIHDEDVFYVVATFDEDIAVDIENDVKHNYQLNLVSPTKFFELIVLPNISNTNIGNNITIDQYLKEILNYYLAAQFDGLESQNEIVIAIDYPAGLGNMVCPEFTLGEPTLREFINYLWAIKNCTFVGQIYYTGLKYCYKITYLDYNQRNNPIHSEDMIITKSNSMDNNATHLRSNLGNVIGENIVDEMAIFKSDSYIWQTSDFKLILNHNIYDMYSFKIIVTARKYFWDWTNNMGGHADFLLELDATDFIYEKKIYDTLHIEEAAGSASATGSWTYPNKNTACFWERGTNVIDGLLTPTQGWLNWSTEYAIDYIVHKCDIDDSNSTLIGGTGSNWNQATWQHAPAGYGYCDENQQVSNIFYVQTEYAKNTIFKIRYKTYDEQCALMTEQSMPIDTRRATLTNNQNDSTINFDKFILSSIEKVNQMGNDQEYFVGMTSDVSRIPVIGDYYGDYTVTNTEVQFTNGIYEYKGNLSKYFINTALYTSIEKQKRYTALASEDEAVTRDEVAVLHSNIYLSNSTSDLPNYSIRSKAACCIFGLDRDADYGAPDLYLLMPVKTKYAGNMITYNINFIDNVVAGRKKGNNYIPGTSTYEMVDVMYTNDDGNIKGVICRWFEDYTLNLYEDTSDMVEALNRLPLQYGLETISGDENGVYNRLFSNNFQFVKDNREKISLTTEIIFKSDSDNIIVGNSFTKLFEESCYVVARTREFTVLDQIINYNECTLLYDAATFATILSNYSYNRIPIAVDETFNIAILSLSGNELILAINNYSGNRICFGTPSTTTGSVNYVVLDFIEPIVSTDDNETFVITNDNDISVTCYWYYVDEEENVLDSGNITLAADSSNSVTPDQSEGVGRLKVKFSNNDLQETDYVYSD